MDLFFVALNSMLSLFICMAAGFICRKKNWINDEINAALSNLMVNISLPCLVISSMQRPFSSSLLLESGIVLALSTLFYLAGGLAGYLITKFFKVNKAEGNIATFVMIFPNIVYMGLPVLRAIFGEDVVFYISVANISFNILLFTLGVSIINQTGGAKEKFNFKKVFFNLPIIATVLGFVLFICRITLPTFLQNGFVMLGSLITPISMLLIGSMLAKSNLKSMFSGKMIYVTSFLRLIVVPVAIYLILRPFISNQMMLATICLIMGMPAASMTAILCEYYKTDTALASKYVFVTTIFSLISIPLVSLLFV